ncbi:lysoplasmalogenase [Arenibacter sp. F26102]|uniref:lysoplasmalogenase n=1 Tax=Arenibacter sp. F26102 TaxID=2926416 RepID=UPI001FF2F375|nr:lysoplasmalogenase [Arenibacter sp. F26102]MCK0145527.1 lysoplasmalogenase [Arenibacter sp. F26102]
MIFRPNAFLGIFILLVLVDLVTGSMHFQELRQLTKPLLLISLILFFGIKGRKLSKKVYRFTLLALCFSLLGDILLLYDHLSAFYFMLGLMAFLFAHISYALVFSTQGKKLFKTELRLVSVILLSYGTTLYIILHDNLGALKIPVIIYILGILTLAITAYSRKDKVNSLSFKLVFIGTMFFIMSDTILAINKFLFVIPLSHLLVMGTYATAQYLIVKGLLASDD